MSKNRCWQCGGLIDEKNQGHWHWCSHNMDTDQNEQDKDDYAVIRGIASCINSDSRFRHGT